MAVLPNQRVLVNRPGTLTPSYGLFRVTQAMGTLSDNLPPFAGQGGLEYWHNVCGLPTCYETNCIDTLGLKPVGDTTDITQGDPFVLLTSLSCGSVGMTEERMRDFLRQKALAGEQAALELAFSIGDCGLNPSLANSTPLATALAASPDPVTAVSLLEEAMYTAYGLTGVIHASYQAGNWLKANHLIDLDAAGIWRTAAGTAVSIGNYAGLSPAGVAPGAGASWIYITGQVSIWRTPESNVFYTPLSGALNRTTNQVNAFREREYVITYECGAFATETTLVVA